MIFRSLEYTVHKIDLTYDYECFLSDKMFKDGKY